MLNVVDNKKWFYLFPAVIVLVGIICYIIFGGFTFDVDFAGGTEMMVDMKKPVDKNEVSGLFEETLGFKPAAVQFSLENKAIITIKSTTLDTEQADKLWNALKAKYNLQDGDRLAFDSVAPTIGKELMKSAVVSTIIAVILMLLYISVRFEFLSGMAAIIALIHDSLIMLAIYAITRMPLNTTFIAAILTIVGYSINDTIVVFDRIRENHKYARKETFKEVANKSVNQTIMRSINTSITTLITIVILYFIGADAIKDFAFALIVGVIAGTYSSIFIATPVWVSLRNVGKKKKA